MDKRQKVLICGVLPPPYFGHSMLYEMLMASSFPQAFQVSFLNMHLWSYRTNKKVTVEKLFRLVYYFCQFVWRLLAFRPRFVFYNISFYRMPFLKDFLFCATAILAGRKLVLHDHGQYVRELHEGLPGWQRCMLRWMLGHSAASIIMGENVRLYYDGLMPRERLLVVPGTAQDTLSLDVPVKKKDGEVVILYFSHMSRDKGVFVAFEALRQILSAFPFVRWVFAGPLENDQVKSCVEKCQQDFPGRVDCLGYIHGVQERTALFRSADIFVFPTLRDVFGLVLLHAMAEGLPVVASREGTIPEILPDEKHGILFEKGNVSEFCRSLEGLITDGQKRALLGRNNRRRFEAVYSLPQYGRTMVQVFGQIN